MPCHRTCIVSMVRPAPRGELHRPADTLPPALNWLAGYFNLYQQRTVVSPDMFRVPHCLTGGLLPITPSIRTAGPANSL